MSKSNQKSLVEQALEKAQKAEAEGNKERANYFFKLAEKAEETLKRARVTHINCEKTKGK